MLTLYTFGPHFGLPDPSPFCMKAMVLLKMSGLSFETATVDLRAAPKGKAPYLDDDGVVVADSTFIRMHLESKYSIDFDEGLGQSERGVAWAFEKMCEDHLYWIAVQSRWMHDANFDAGPRHFFDAVPALIRPFVIKSVRRKIARDLVGQGAGRHSDAENLVLATRSIESLADFLGNKKYFMGPTPSGADATVFSMVAGLLVPIFTSSLMDAVAAHDNLLAYRDRMMRSYFPEFCPG